MHHTLSLANVALRGLLETGIVVGSGYWGYTLSSDTALRILLTLMVPLIAFGFWGTIEFRFAGRHAETLRLTQELAVTVLVGAALYNTGHHALASGLPLLSLVHHAAVYLLGERLLKSQPA